MPINEAADQEEPQGEQQQQEHQLNDSADRSRSSSWTDKSDKSETSNNSSPTKGSTPSSSIDSSESSHRVAGSGQKDTSEDISSGSSSNSSSGSSSRKLQEGTRAKKKKRWVSRGPLQQSLTFLENEHMKIGVDLQRAGAISWISSSNMPGKWKDTNLINTWDNGRLLQQSFYGCKDSSCWLDRPWLWNPVQAGSWQNLDSKTKEAKVEPNKVIRVKGHPR